MMFASVRLDDFLDDDPITKGELMVDPRFSRGSVTTTV
jgi:hypothetical protein